MNERIIELANKANEKIGYTFKLEDANQIHELLEKFAELIVRECAKALDDKLSNPNSANMAYCDGSDLLKHFGVE